VTGQFTIPIGVSHNVAPTAAIQRLQYVHLQPGDPDFPNDPTPANMESALRGKIASALGVNEADLTSGSGTTVGNTEIGAWTSSLTFVDPETGRVAAGKSGYAVSWDVSNAKATADGLGYDFSQIKVRIVAWYAVRINYIPPAGSKIESVRGIGLRGEVSDYLNTLEHERAHVFGFSADKWRELARQLQIQPIRGPLRDYQRRLGLQGGIDQVLGFLKQRMAVDADIGPFTDANVRAKARSLVSEYLVNSLAITFEGLWHGIDESRPYMYNYAINWDMIGLEAKPK
jgi:hypothetical protein